MTSGIIDFTIMKQTNTAVAAKSDLILFLLAIGS
jgi:hypothetical protein